MLCPNCGTNIEDNANICVYCGETVKSDRINSTLKEYYPENLDKKSSLKSAAKIFAIVTFVIICLAAIAIGVNYYKQQEKYSDLNDTYGLSFSEIEDNISHYYQKWYSPFGYSVNITKDKLTQEAENGEKNACSYKVTNIYARNAGDVYTLTVFANGVYMKLMPLVKKDDNGDVEYHFLKCFYGGSDGKSFSEEYDLLYDRPIDEIP